jgi:type I restriction enzyme S subunit
MSVRAPVGPVNIATQKICIGRGLAAIRPDTSKVLLEYVFINLRFMQDEIKGNSGSTFASINRSDIAKIQIPLPPLEIQHQLVDEIATHQRIIDGARQVVEGWKPNVEIDPDWDIVGLDTVCDIQRGKFSYRPRNEPRFYGGKYPFIQTGDIVRADGGKITYTQTLNDEGLSVSKLFQPPIVVITIAANIGDTAVLDFASCFPDSVVGLTPKSQIDVYFLELMMRTQKQYLNDIAPQAAQKNINIEILKTVKIPLPPLEIQREIVARIETERAIVHGNQELIKIYELKIKKVIEKVWEG